MIRKELIDPLHKERKKLYKQAAAIDKAIRALQDLCEHDWKEDGHDSHKTHHICKICSKQESW